MSSIRYSDFLEGKKKRDVPTGHAPGDINEMLFDFQTDITRWAIKRGRAAIWADCGLGKTPMQLEWAKHIHDHTGEDVLILAPLAVSKQTKREGKKFGVDVNICRGMDGVKNGINIANYEMLHNFDPGAFGGVVLDESSILKNYSGAIRNAIIEAFNKTPYRLACTATPAPNDYMEIGNHSEFLGVMTRSEMLASFFIHDGSDTAKWRLKGHAEDDFWAWLCSWAVMIRNPSDLGYEDNGFILPELEIHHHVIESDTPTEGMLFAVEAQTLNERRQARKATIDERVLKTAEIANSVDGPFLAWCNLNNESEKLTAAINGAVEVTGSHSMESKENAMLGFTHGDHLSMVTKPKIAGMGMNWQHCSDMAFVGLSDSFEQYYQAVRRCWRFGQKNKVNVHIVTADTEGAVVANIQRKEADAERMAQNMVKHMQEISSQEIRGANDSSTEYKTGHTEGDGWKLHHGDCVEVARSLPDESVGYSVFSPPFASLYTYSASDRDMGNAANNDEFYTHFGFLVDELFRVLQKGRLVSFHCMNIPAMKERDGYIGIKDFRGDLIRLFQNAGFIYHAEVMIWKDPLIEAVRTKAIGLMHKQLCKDSSVCRQGLPDYVITMKKPGENGTHIAHHDGLTKYIGEGELPDGNPSHNTWRKYASPVWMDIRQTNTLNFRAARTEKDERHICPLQLDVIERCIELWSAEGDTVFSPFTGIGSEGYVALQEGRQFVGSELKEEYYRQAIINLESASNPKQMALI